MSQYSRESRLAEWAALVGASLPDADDDADGAWDSPRFDPPFDRRE